MGYINEERIADFTEKLLENDKKIRDELKNATISDEDKAKIADDVSKLVIQQTVRKPSTNGVSGQVLVTNGDGTTKWDTVQNAGGGTGTGTSVVKFSDKSTGKSYLTSTMVGNITVTPTSSTLVSSTNLAKFSTYTYNLTPFYPGDTVNVAGVTVKYNEDGTLTLNGTSTGSAFISTNIDASIRDMLIGRSVKMTFYISDSSSIAFNSLIKLDGNSYGHNLTASGSVAGSVTGNQSDTGYARITIGNGVTYNNTVVSFMLEVAGSKYVDSFVPNKYSQKIDSTTTLNKADFDEKITLLSAGEFTIEYDTTSSTGGSGSGSTSKLGGRSLVFAGDSLCAGEGYAGGYCTLLSEVEPDASVFNLALGGSRISSNHPSGGRFFIENQLNGAPSDTYIDYVICEGYVNDYLTGCPLGTISTGYTATLDTTTFYGGMESLCKKIISKFPEARKGFIITHRMTTSSSGPVAESTEYIKAIKECCDKWSLPYVDLSNIINPSIPGYSIFYSDSSLHYNELGYRHIFNLILDFIYKL